MPKRVIDGDALWVSEKLTTVPEKYRAEYAWLIPLANSNGCFECSPMIVWRTCYSGVRTDWSIADVTEMLDTFESSQMLFRFQRDGKTFGFFIGAQKEGRLPKPSDRVKSAKQWQSGMLPEKQLAKFLGVTVKKLPEEYRDLLATNSRPTRDVLAERSPTGIGIGNGTGDGMGTGVGDGMGIGNGSGNGQEAASLPSPDNAHSDIASSLSNQDQGKDANNAKTHPFDDDPELEGEPEIEDNSEDMFDSNDSDKDNRGADKYPFAYHTAKGFAQLWKLLMKDNPKAEIPKGWEQRWEPDFKKLLNSVTTQAMADIIAITQTADKKKYWLRPAKLIERLPLCKTMVREREKKKLMGPIRMEFKRKVARLEGTAPQPSKYPMKASI